MSKMDRQLNSKKDKETIYEIYRACRLCGAGAGYKMPIIQNVVDLDDTDVELRQKVRDCLQIEVHQDDKMPPLICELCVDKVNDFYEFLEMCRQTNKRTRLRLGLPPQSMPKGAPDAGECILGLTEPVYVNEDSDGEPLSKQKKMNPKVKVKREPELKVRLEKRVLTETRPSRYSKRAATPPRITRHRASSKEENVSLSRLKDTKSQKPAPKSILKKDSKNDDNSLTPRLKRTRDKEPVKLAVPHKKVKITTRTSSSSSLQTPKSSPQTPKSSPKTSPRVATKPSKAPVRPPSPPRVFKCPVCSQASKTPQANSNHLRSHTVGFTSPKLACNPCGLWFSSADEAAAHHRQHRNKSKPYNCRRCDTDFRQLSSYDEHLQNNDCIPFDEVPDVKCEECWHLFATNKLLEDHKCLGEDHRPGGKCGKCRRNYALLKNLKKHELTCTAKKKGELIVDPVLLGQVKPIQIRMSRCDPLLSNLKQEHYDVSNVTPDYGLDKNCVYPYISSYSSLRIKSDPDGMVDIQDEIKNAFYIEEDYIHWDSEDTDTDGEESSLIEKKKKKIDTLANLALKTIFSKKCLGKVPKKKRTVKQEKNMFDSLLAGSEDDITRDINSIIDNLGGDDDDFNGGKGDDCQKVDSDKIMDVSDDKLTDGDKNYDKSDVIDSADVKSDDKVTKDDEKDINSASKVNDKEMEGSNNNLSSNNSVDDKINNVTINLNSLSFDYDDGVVISKKNYDVSSPLSKDESQNDGSDAKNDENTKIDYENSQDSNSIGGGSDSLLNTQNDKENIDKISIDNTTSLSEQTSDVDEVKSQTVDNNLNQDSKFPEFEEDKSQINDKQTDDSQNSDIIEKERTNAISVIVNSGKSKAQKDSEELDDSKLMADLDAQIGENNEISRDENSRELSENSQEQINKNSQEQINQKSREQINEDSRELSENSQEKINQNSQEQINENSQDQINENCREQSENSQEQINENSREQINENSREQINDNFNDRIALEDLMTDKNSDLAMIPEEFNFDA